ncbi:M23 family metallopeptidase [Streptomyces sp. NBC_01455]|uniref:M23 family metallopeptidase n=1 Tax=Streptomyces sp. NBC_01455 TaxID=2903874 RepID=UPI002E37A15F|nr:M23 family metallopeptidase [Streptomyces sp. NBC_01455]
MRAKRYVRTWLELLPGITAAALAVPAVSAMPAVHAAPAPSPVALAARTSSSRTNGPAPPVPAEPPDADAQVPAVARLWPVGTRPSVLRAWQPPATPYGRGHRGVDLAAAPGAPVRSVAPGRVSFAGRVAGRGAVAVELAGTGDPPLRTTFTPVRATVRKGDEVAAGEVLGTLEADGSHCPTSCLHWGLLRDRTYLDPLSLLPSWLLHRAPSRLLPVPTARRQP